MTENPENGASQYIVELSKTAEIGLYVNQGVVYILWSGSSLWEASLARCPKCLASFDGVRHWVSNGDQIGYLRASDRPPRPKDGDYSICFSCCLFLRWNNETLSVVPFDKIPREFQAIREMLLYEKQKLN